MSDQIPKPHDRFFKLAFTDTSKAVALLKGMLPATLVGLLDLDNLELDSNSYIDERLKEHFSDLVYNCTYQGSSFSLKVVLLFEHKSYVSKHIHLQLLRYMLNVWERMEANKEPLCPVIPLLVYHGDVQWHVAPLWSYFSDPFPENLLPFLPSFEYVMLNLESKPVAEIETDFKDQILQKILILMKFIRDQELENYADTIFAYKGIDAEPEQLKQYFRKFIEYLYKGSKMSKQTIARIEKSLDEYWGYEPGSAAEELVNEGLLKGRQEGRQEGLEKGLQEGLSEGLQKARQVIVRSMMGKGLSAQEIADLTDIALEEVSGIMAKFR